MRGAVASSGGAAESDQRRDSFYEIYLNVKKRYRVYIKRATMFRRFAKRCRGRRPQRGKGQARFRRQFGKPGRFPTEDAVDMGPTFYKGRGKGRDLQHQRSQENRKDPVAGEAKKRRECGSGERARRNCPNLNRRAQAVTSSAAAASSALAGDQALAGAAYMMQQHFF